MHLRSSDTRLAALPSQPAICRAPPQAVLDARKKPVWVGVPGRPEFGQVALYHDAAGQYYAHTGGRGSNDYALHTDQPATAVARIRDWLQQASPPMQGIYGRSSTVHLETGLRALGISPAQVKASLSPRPASTERAASVVTRQASSPSATFHQQAQRSEAFHSLLRPRFVRLFAALDAAQGRPIDGALRKRVNDVKWEIDRWVACTGRTAWLTPAQREGLQKAQLFLQQPRKPVAAGAAPAAKNPLDEQANWLYENLKLRNQRIFNLWKGPHDYVVRVVSERNAVGRQPASISVKTTLAGVGLDLRLALRTFRDTAVKRSMPNMSIQYVSSALKSSTGTKLQFGYDVMHSPKNKRADYSRLGEPVMDLISIETKAEGIIGRLRTKLDLKLGKAPALESMMQQAVAIGGYIRWRRVWEDPITTVKSGIDVVLGMKAEAAVNTGGGKGLGGLSALEGRTDIEATVRYFGPLTDAFDAPRLQASAMQAIGQLLSRGTVQAPKLRVDNGGDKNLARRSITSQVLFGTPLWRMAEEQVAGGKNHGHFALDLAIRTNRLLYAAGVLRPGQSLKSTAQATQLLRSLWQQGSGSQRLNWARTLANPMGINFSLQELRTANAGLPKNHVPNPRVEAHRKLFLGMY
jgi:hypothetical protein